MRTRSAKILVFLSLFIFILAACSQASPAATNPPATEPTRIEPTASSVSPTDPEPIATNAPANPTEPAAADTGARPTATSAPAASDAPSFSQDVLPILEANCTRCHGSSRQSDGLAMNTYTALLEGSTTGAVVTPSDAAGSKLVEVISNGRMPKNATPLTAEEIQLISDWINAGALDN